MHARTTGRVCPRLCVAGVAALALLQAHASFAVGVPGSVPDIASHPPASTTDPSAAATANAALAASPEPELLVQWEFKYKGPHLKAEGLVTTKAKPSRDGTYEILAISGKRNRKNILLLEPPGELITMYGPLFSDNRLWVQSPHLNQSGFSFRTKRGRYFNVCYSGPYEGCGDGNLGYFEHDFKGVPVPIEFSLKRLDTVLVAAPTTPAEGQETQPVVICGAIEHAPSVSGSAVAVASYSGASGSSPASTELTCAPEAPSSKHL